MVYLLKEKTYKLEIQGISSNISEMLPQMQDKYFLAVLEILKTYIPIYNLSKDRYDKKIMIIQMN
jgi:hypothetical protein